MAQTSPPFSKRAWQAAAIYAACGAVWIITSDTLLSACVDDAEWHLRLSVAKGWAYVLLTAVLAYVLIARRDRELAREVLARDALEAETREREEMFRALVERLPIAVVTHVGDHLVYANPEACRILGVAADPAALRALAPADFIAPEEREVATARIRRALEHNETAAPRVSRIHSMTGGAVEVEIAVEPILLKQRRAALVLFRDMTEQRRLEEQLRHAQKMEAVGLLAGGVAHDFNNFLTIVRGNATLLTDEKLPTGEVRELAAELLLASDRATALTRQLLVFSGRRAAHRRTADLGEVVDALAKMLRRLIGEHIALRIEHPALLPPIHADVGMVEQAIVNLVVNARDAMPNGGELRLRTGCTTFEACPGEEPAGATPPRGACVSIAVTDTGTGIAPDVLPRIFEPFFTTKAVGAGTGLGLATVRGIVKQHGGRVLVESAPGSGTTFTLLWPAAPTPAVALPSVELSDALPRGFETILVVEDDEPVRHVVTTVLRRCGYTVIAAADGLEAEERLAAVHDDVALVVTDLVMPGPLDGLALVRRIRARRPSVAALYMSGYAAELPGRRELVEGQNFLQKPFTIEEFATAVRRRLDGLAAGG